MDDGTPDSLRFGATPSPFDEFDVRNLQFAICNFHFAILFLRINTVSEISLSSFIGSSISYQKS